MEKVKFGVFGAARGTAFMKAIGLIEEADLTAVCDMDPKRIEAAKEYCNSKTKLCSDFDELLDSGIDAVVLCNYFHEHTPYAIRAMEKGIHVLSETLPASTLRECVELTEAVERTGCVYAFAENYPFTRANMELARVYQSGLLGEVTFAEGEYVHPMSPEETEHYMPGPYHWRRHLPRTYYSTHSLAPLMVATDLMPKRVIGKIAAARNYAKARNRKDYDGAGIMLVEMSNGAVFRISGSCNFGGHGNWYRLGCEKGEIESLRGTNDQVRLVVDEWEKQDRTSDLGAQCVYYPRLTERGEKALQCGHSGGDYWVTWHFVQSVLGKEAPYMNVYRAAAITATAIMGWRSVLEDSRQMDIPDFTDPSQRDLIRSDDLSPFPTKERLATLPSFHYLFAQDTQET